MKRIEQRSVDGGRNAVPGGHTLTLQPDKPGIQFAPEVPPDVANQTHYFAAMIGVDLAMIWPCRLKGLLSRTACGRGSDRLITIGGNLGWAP